MNASPFASIAAMRLERDGTIFIEFTDRPSVSTSLGREVFEPTSSIASTTYLPRESLLKLKTTCGHDFHVVLPQPGNLSPLYGRPTIYLDQNHWSTLTNAIHEPRRVTNEREHAAAVRLIELATAQQVVLPMSAGHISETCKQVDTEQRYRRALTIAQLSAGWQLRDPLDLRRFELRQALTIRYHQRQLPPLTAVTLEPDAILASRENAAPSIGVDLPQQFQWVLHMIQSIGGIVDTMLDTEHVPTTSVSGWVADFQKFSEFLQNNPTGREVKRRRTHAKFIADLGRELPEEAHRAGITPQEMSDWALNHSEEDLRSMPTLGLFREILHEKLSDGKLRWEDNDLTDMMYLTAAVGYCDHVVGERSHISHIANGLRRLNRTVSLHRNLRSFVEQL